MNGISVDDVVEKIGLYVEESREFLPILKECCLDNDWDYDELMELAEAHPDVKRAVNRLLNRSEVNLIKDGISGKINKPVMITLLDRNERERESKSRLLMLEAVDGLLRADEIEAEEIEDE